MAEAFDFGYPEGGNDVLGVWVRLEQSAPERRLVPLPPAQPTTMPQLAWAATRTWGRTSNQDVVRPETAATSP